MSTDKSLTIKSNLQTPFGIGSNMYRYTVFFTGGGTDDEGCFCLRRTHLILSTYMVTKRTAKGVWVVESGELVASREPRFVLLGAKKRLCYETKRQALTSLIARQTKRHQILRREADDCLAAIAMAKDELVKVI